MSDSDGRTVRGPAVSDYNTAIIASLYERGVEGWSLDDLSSIASQIDEKIYETRQEQLLAAIKTLENIIKDLETTASDYLERKYPDEYESTIRIQAKYKGFLARLKME